MTATMIPQRNIRSAVPVGLATVLAYLAVGAGVVYAATAVAGDAWARVPVELTAQAPAWQEVVLPCVEGWSLDGISGCGPSVQPQQWPAGEGLPTQRTGGLVAESPAASTTTTLLSMSPVWGSLIAGGAALLILIPMIRSTAEGRPFAPSNSWRLAAAAAVTAAGWGVATVGPYVAAGPVIRLLEETPRIGADGEFFLPSGWLAPDLSVPWWPVLVIAILACFSAATRRGTRLAADTEGLV